MTKRVVITISKFVLGLFVLAMHILVCHRLVGWAGTAVIITVQVAIGAWIVYMHLIRLGHFSIQHQYSAHTWSVDM